MPRKKPKHIGRGVHIHEQQFTDVIDGDTFFDTDHGMMIYENGKWVNLVYQVGDKVHYIPFKGAGVSLYENGMVKELVDDESIRVVYHCNDDWNNYKDYTSALTQIIQLRKDWISQ